jgi:hypothetical protein
VDAPYHGCETAFGENLGGGVEHRAATMRSRCLGTGESWKDGMTVGSPKNVLPRVDPEPVGARTESRISSRRLRRLSRFERWHARRLDRLAERVERRRDRLTVRWEKLTRQRRREGLAIRLRHRWYLLSERVEPLVELLMIRWYRFWNRFAFGVAVRWERMLVAGGLSVALAVAVVTLLPLGAATPDPKGPAPTDPPSAPEPSTGPSSEPETSSPVPSTDLSIYTNDLTGYSFSYPNDWDVSTTGTATTLSDPDGEFEISFEGAPTGSLQQASDGVLEQFTSTYNSHETVATQVNETSQHYPSIAVGGVATDSTGAQIRFLAITIQGPKENRAIFVRFPPDPDPHDLDALLGVVYSFRITQAA